MSKKVKVMLVDDNKEYGMLTEQFFENDKQINIICVVNNGEDAVSMIKKNKPNVLILDLIMPGLDGIGVLEELKRTDIKNKPIIIVASALGKDITVSRALSLGAEYYMLKPFNYETLKTRILQIYSERNKYDIQSDSDINYSDNFGSLQSNPISELDFESYVEETVTKCLRAEGISAHLLGYRYLREAISHTIIAKLSITSLKSQIYPYVSEMFQTSPEKVERAIRNSIEKAWINHQDDGVDFLLGFSSRSRKGRPTNSEFIFLLIECVKTDLKRRGIHLR